MADEKNSNLIPLSKLASLTPYSVEYLSLRARQGKLKAIKINNVWHSTKADIKEYLKTQSEIQKAKTPELKQFYKRYEANPFEKISVQLVSSFKKLFAAKIGEERALREPRALGEPGLQKDIWDEILLGEEPAVKKAGVKLSWQLKPILGGLLASALVTFLIFGNSASAFAKVGEFFKPLAKSLEDTVLEISDGLADTSEELAQDVLELTGGMMQLGKLTSTSLNNSLTTTASDLKYTFGLIGKSFRVGIFDFASSVSDFGTNFGTTLSAIKMPEMPELNIGDFLANAAFTLGSVFDKAEESITQGLEKTGGVISDTIASSTNVLNKTGLGLTDVLKKGAANIASKTKESILGLKSPSTPSVEEAKIAGGKTPGVDEKTPGVKELAVLEELEGLRSELSQLKSKGVSVSAPPAKLTSKNFITQDDLALAFASLASKGDLENQLGNLNQKILSQIQDLKNQLVEKTQANFNAVALTQRINNLSSPTISSPTISSPAISSPTITGTSNLATLSVSGNLTVSGTQTFSGNQSIAGNLTLGDATSTDIIYLNSKFAGSILPTSDNVLDIGGAGQRFQTGYFGTSVVVGGGTSTSSANSLLASGAYTLDSAGILSINTTNNQNIVTGTGNLGVGTSTPNWKLQAAGTRPFFALSDTGATANLKHWTISSQSGNLYFATSSDALATSSIPALVIDSNGNLGISTTSPYAKLSVNGLLAASNFNADSSTATSTFAWGIQTNLLNIISTSATSTAANGWNISAGCFAINGTCVGGGGGSLIGSALTKGYFVVGDDAGLSQATSSIFISSTGQVGIGTTTPATNLAVGGNLYLTGNIMNTANLTATGTLTFSGLGTNMLASINSLGQLVATSTPTAGYYLATSTVASVFPYASSTGLTVTGTASTTNLYVSGNQYISPLTSGSIVFAGASGLLSQDNANLYWDDSNNRLGIGTTTPNWLTQIAGTRPFLTLSDTGGAANLKHWTLSSQSGNLYFATSSDALATSSIPALVIDSNGNLGISTTSPYAKLSVNGLLAASYFNADSSTATSTFAWGIQTNLLNIISTSATSTAANGWNISAGCFAINGTCVGGGGSLIGSALTKGYFVVGDDAGLSQATSSIFISSTGQVGIGTTTPNWLLQTAGARPFFTLSDTGAGTDQKHWYLSSQGGNFYIGTSTDALSATSTALSLDSVSRAVSLGFYALKSNQNSGLDNTAVGYNALAANTTGGYNVAIGSFALDSNTTESFGTALGYNALTANTTGSANTAVGYGALDSNTSGDYNVAVGYNALTANASLDDNNTAIGYNALAANTTDDNTAVGYTTLDSNTSGRDNVAVGSTALTANTTASYNTAVGSGALDSNTTGASNTAVGYNALTANTTPGGLTAIGTSALTANTTGDNNTALGFAALQANTTGNNNTAMGYKALQANTTSASSTAVGNFSLFSSTGSHNTAFGGEALYLNTTGASSTALGYRAGFGNTTGSFNTYLGFDAGSSSVATLTYATAIGAGAQVNRSSSLILGGTGTYAVNVGIGTTTPNWLLQAAGTRPLFVLSDTGAAAGNKHWYLSSQGGNLYVGTTTDAYATTTGYQALTITNAGNVGIGTAGPTEKLTITGAGTVISGTAVSTFSTQQDTDPRRGVLLGYDSGGQIGIIAASTAASASNLAFWTYNASTWGERVRIDGSGNVGIGTTSPGSLLSLNNIANFTTATSTFYGNGINLEDGCFAINGTCVGGGGSLIGSALTKGYFVVGDDAGLSQATSSIFISSTGQVGLGTSTPNWLLQTAGTRPFFALSDTGAGTDQKHWYLSSQGGNFYIGTSTDALSATSTSLVIDANAASGITALGSQAGNQGIGSTFIGFQSGLKVVAGADYNTAVGYRALKTLTSTTGDYNTAVGYLALTANTSGTNNTAVGSNALDSNTTGYFNTAVGESALTANTTGDFNTAVGNDALDSNTSGSYNTAVGNDALDSNTSGYYNTAVGDSAIDSNTSGSYNTAVGRNALTANTTGDYNTAMGYGALDSNTTGANNTAIGYYALQSNTTAASSTAMGGFSLFKSTGSHNTAFGGEALYLNTTGASSTALGYRAGFSNTTGSFNTYLGFDAGSSSVATLTYATAIGAGAQVNRSSSLILGGIDTYAVNVGIGTTTPNWLLQAAGTRPFFALSDTGAAAGNKHWYLSSQGGNLYVGTTTDAYATTTGYQALTILNNGNVGIGTTSPSSALSIEGTCIDTGTGCADIAELYPASEEVEPGDIVAVDYEKPGSVKKALREPGALGEPSEEPAVIGIVSSNPAIVIEGSGLQLMTGSQYSSSSNKPAIALAGKVPVKVNLEGGEIVVGDRITISSMAGVGKKAFGRSPTGETTSSGMAVGIALENFDGSAGSLTPGVFPPAVGKIMVFVNLGYSKLDPQISGGIITGNDSAFWSIDESSGAIKFINGLDLNDFGIINVKAIRGAVNPATGEAGWSIDSQGKLLVQEIETEKLKVSSEATFGSSEKRIGITIYDEETGEPYCIKVRNGAMVSVAGICGEAQTNEAGSSTSDVSPSTSDVLPPAEEPEPEPEPEPAPEPESQPQPEPEPVIEEPPVVENPPAI